ncbi:hypothetical protein J31TS3_26070 [Paenibacillus lactis]|nr:hypothetical protein J31TS3_26070 [Paenibacillus lactis]
MSKILVPPEVLLSVSEQFNRASNQLEANSNTLNQHIQMLASCWDGTTCSRFYYDFQQAYRDMKLTIEHMQVTSQELKKIAYKFMQVDNEQGNLDPRCASPQTLNSLGMSNDHYEKAIKEKSFGDHVNELGMEFKAFGVGVQAAAAEMWDSAKDTANALIEEPVETGKQMAYNATIGTAEEIVKTTIWGAKMALDIGDTREKLGEEVQAEQELINEMGTSTYLGQQAAMIFGGFALKRLGVKDTPNLKKDSGGDGGKGGAGTGDTVPSYGKNSVPIGPYREVNGFPVKVKPGAQEKHIPNTPNYKQEIANGKNKSIFYGDNKAAQELLDEFAGKGQLLPKGNKERVDFGKPIGKYYDSDTGEYLETTRGIIHYGKDGAHIVPSEPLKE